MAIADITSQIPDLPVLPIGDEVIVWSKPGCVQCKATERALTEKGLEHRVVDLTEHPEAVDKLRGAGFLQAPFVQFGADGWMGFRPDKIKEIAQALEAR